LRVVTDDGLPLWHLDAVHRCQWGELDFVVQTGGGDRLLGGSGIFEMLPQTVPRRFAVVHHRRLAVFRCEIVSHGIISLVRTFITKRVTRESRGLRPREERCS
jgi:hypothetical protein